MRTFFLGLLVFSLYATFARYYYVCEIMGLCDGEEIIEAVLDQRPKTLNLMEGDSILLKEYDQFSFPTGSILPALNGNNTQFLDLLEELLTNDPAKNLSITGYYLNSEKESRTGVHENLGIARAAAVRDLLIDRGIAAERLFIDAAMVDKTLLVEPLRFKCTPLEPSDSLYLPDLSIFQTYS
ncbi:MAG: hypothetical protein AAFP19_02730 [Bacteroidota bacterium]